MNLKKLAAVAALSVLSSASFAFAATPMTTVEQDVLYKFSGTGDGTYTFNTIGTLFNATGTTVSFGDPADITSVSLDGHALTDLFSDGSYWTWSGTLSGTSHSLVIDVTGSELYKGSVSLVAAPVPEPESYAMMLAGLGALGFMARRRKTK
jgi:hypothetical protein